LRRRSRSSSYGLRTFFHLDWLPVVGMVIFGTFFGQLSSTILGYGLFRVASDVEKLPFPMAPIGAQGIMALAEDADEKNLEQAEGKWRWRVFSIGGALGLAFGAVYLLLPTLTGALTGQPITDIPDSVLGLHGPDRQLPFGRRHGHLVGFRQPDLRHGAAVLRDGRQLHRAAVTFVMNPILHQVGILKSWTPGDNTISTIYLNNIDFYFSFHIGIAIAIAIGGLWQVYKSLRNSRNARRQTSATLPRSSLAAVPEGRGDIKTWLIMRSTSSSP
jgi:hypothetical protein